MDNAGENSAVLQEEQRVTNPGRCHAIVMEPTENRHPPVPCWAVTHHDERIRPCTLVTFITSGCPPWRHRPVRWARSANSRCPTMPRDSKFEARICEDPDNTVKRKIYADWLDANGDENLGRFIRLQCEVAERREELLATLPGRGERLLTEIRAKSAMAIELLNKHRDEWERPCRDHGAIGPITFSRGFPSHCDISAADLWESGHHLFAQVPLNSLRIRFVPGEYGPFHSAAELAMNLLAQPFMAKVHTLDLTGDRLGDVFVRALVLSPQTKNLRALSLRESNIGPEGARMLADSGSLPDLTRLDLSGNPIEDAGAIYFATSPNSRRFERLVLENCGITLAGHTQLTDSPYFRAGRHVVSIYPQQIYALEALTHGDNTDRRPQR